MPIRCVVLFAKDYFLLRAKAISGKERLADQHKGLTQKIFGVNQRFLYFVISKCFSLISPFLLGYKTRN